jgi:hypothetical protein
LYSIFCQYNEKNSAALSYKYHWESGKFPKSTALLAAISKCEFKMHENAMLSMQPATKCPKNMQTPMGPATLGPHKFCPVGIFVPVHPWIRYGFISTDLGLNS